MYGHVITKFSRFFLAMGLRNARAHEAPLSCLENKVIPFRA